jgi:hypothetical protein
VAVFFLSETARECRLFPNDAMRANEQVLFANLNDYWSI